MYKVFNKVLLDTRTVDEDRLVLIFGWINVQIIKSYLKKHEKYEVKNYTVWKAE